MKRTIALLLAVAVLLMGLAACNTKKETEQTTSETHQTTEPNVTDATGDALSDSGSPSGEHPGEPPRHGVGHHHGKPLRDGERVERRAKIHVPRHKRVGGHLPDWRLRRSAKRQAQDRHQRNRPS